MMKALIPSTLAQQVFGSSLLERITISGILQSIVVLLTAWLIIRWLARLFNFLSRRAPRARFLFKLLEPTTRIGLWFAAIFLSLNILAPSRETFLAAIASLGLALGLGAQDLIKNLIGGLVVLADRPFQLGDRVKMGEAYGEIDHIGLRSTKMTTPDDTRVTIPNAEILNNKVFNANYGVSDCQVVTDLFVPADTDPDLALRIGHEAASCSPYLLLRKPISALVSQAFDRRAYMQLRIKAYVFDHRYEPKMQSDITARATREMLRRGILQGFQKP